MILSKALIGHIIQYLRYIYIFCYWDQLFVLFSTTRLSIHYPLTRLLVHHWIIVVNYSCQRSWLIEVGQNVCLLMTKPRRELVSLFGQNSIYVYTWKRKKKITICLETLPSFATATVNAQKPTMGPWLTTQFSEVVRHRFWPFHLSNRRM